MKNSLRPLWIALLLAVMVDNCLSQTLSPAANNYGFVNMAMRPGYTLFSNPLIGADDSIGAMFVQAPEGAMILKWGNASGTAILPEPEQTTADNWLRQASSVSAGGKVYFTFNKGVLKLAWDGALQHTDRLDGAYGDASNLKPPLEILPAQSAQPRQFWRATAAAGAVNIGLSLSQFSAVIFQNGQWSDPAMTLDPGEGAIFYNPDTNAFNAGFVGALDQGTLTVSIPAGISLVSSRIPVSGGITTKLLLKPNPGDQVFLWTGTEFQTFTYQSNQSWSPLEPLIPTAGAFFIRANEPFIWQRFFSVNP